MNAGYDYVELVVVNAACPSDAAMCVVLEIIQLRQKKLSINIFMYKIKCVRHNSTHVVLLSVTHSIEKKIDPGMFKHIYVI